MARVTRCAFIIVLLLPVLLVKAAAQEAETPVFGTDVSVVMLPVFVIGSDGRAVRGLQPEDFVVEEDGEEVDIVSFLYVDTTTVGEEQEEIRLASAARRRFFLLFDKSFTHPAGLYRAQLAAAEFVRTGLAPSDLAAVATFDVRRGVQVVANFTEDRGLLAHAIRTLGVPQLSKISDPLGLAADIGFSELQSTAGDDLNQGIPQPLLDSVLDVLVQQMRSAEEQEYQSNLQMLAGGLRDLATALRDVDGRKQIVYLSAGFDARIFTGQQGEEQRMASESIAAGRLWEVDGLSRYGDSRLREDLLNVTDELARADAVMHSFDVTGLVQDDSLSQQTVSRGFTRDVANRESLNFFAAETGGRFFRDSNDLRPALAEMLEMTSRYYVLGFQPREQKGPGGYHKIKVKVDRKKVKLSHRKGYFEQEPAGPGQPVLKQQFDAAQLVLTGAGGNELRFSSLCLPFPSADEKQVLGVIIQVPKGSLRWGEGQETEVEVYGYAVAEDSTVADHIAQFARVDPARADPDGSKQGVSFFGTLAVPPGRYTIRLLVREHSTGLSGIEFLDVTVPRHDPDAAFLLPPVVIDEPERWLGVGLGAGKLGGRDVGYPFQAGGQPFLPRASLEVQPGRQESLVLLAYEPHVIGDPAEDLEIRSSMTADDGRVVPPGRLRVNRVHHDPDGRRAYVFDYVPEEIEKGDYTLRIRVAEAGTITEAYALLRVRPEEPPPQR